jgi:hypothetical protein
MCWSNIVILNPAPVTSISFVLSLDTTRLFMLIFDNSPIISARLLLLLYPTQEPCVTAVLAMDRLAATPAVLRCAMVAGVASCPLLICYHTHLLGHSLIQVPVTLQRHSRQDSPNQCLAFHGQERWPFPCPMNPLTLPCPPSIKLISG